MRLINEPRQALYYPVASGQPQPQVEGLSMDAPY